MHLRIFMGFCHRSLSLALLSLTLLPALYIVFFESLTFSSRAAVVGDSFFDNFTSICEYSWVSVTYLSLFSLFVSHSLTRSISITFYIACGGGR